MKKLMLPIIICGFLIFAGSAWSLTIQAGSIVVGSWDSLLAADDVGSGDATELNWVKSVLGTDNITLDAKYTTMTWFPVDSAPGFYAIDFATDNPEYFLVKTGAIAGTSNDHFLFQNNPSLAWGVISLPADLGITDINNIAKISHVDEFNSQVPEPAALLLLGAGLLGLWVVRRRK